MRRVVLFRIGGIIVTVFGFMIILMSITPLPNKADNGFSRKFIENKELKQLNIFQFSEPMTRIVGITDEMIYLSGDSPTGLLAINKISGKKDTLFVEYSIPVEKMVPFYLEVDSANFYMHLNNLKTVLFGKFPKETLQICTLNSRIFTKSVQVSQDEIVIRTFTPSYSDQLFQKYDLNTGQKIGELNIPDLEDGAGGVSTDGILKYDKIGRRIIYVEAFRNRFYCLDTGLNLMYKGHTIDTFSINSIGLVSQKMNDSTSKFVPNSARKNVCSDFILDNDYLYIVSSLRADNQSHSEYNGSVSLDRYNLNNGSYEGSLLVDKIKNKSFRSAMIFNSTFYALFEGRVVAYRLN